MKVTSLKGQVKNTERVSVYVDGAYSFSLNQSQLLEQQLRIGYELDEARLSELKQISDFGKLYERILRYTMLRPHSQREVEEYCKRKHFDEAECQVIISNLLERKYINDELFARAWVENRRLNKAVSERRLRLELKQKGISDELIAHAIAEGSYEEEGALKSLIVKKRRQQRYQDEQTLLHYLMRQGFTYDAIRQALHDGIDS